LITPRQIFDKALKKYPLYLKSLITGEKFFPLNIKFAKINPADALEDYTSIDRWIESLHDNSALVKGYGYKVDYKTVNNRKIGSQQFPDRIFFDDDADYLKYVGKSDEAALFKNVSNLLLDKYQNSYPLVKDFCINNSEVIIRSGREISNVCKVVDYFIQNNHPGIYIREIPLDIDTKFIENFSKIISGLLDIVISEHIQTDQKLFEKRYNLKYAEPLVRINILDVDIAAKMFSGINDISLTVSDFSSLKIPVKNVIIIENKTNFSNIQNFLTLPQLSGTIAVFGSGYAVNNLQNSRSLKNKRILYWGDIDPHGFKILSDLRAFLPQTESLLMDSKTFLSHENYLTDAPNISTVSKLCLTEDESQLFNDINNRNNLNRLEQERILHSYAKMTILRIL